MKVIIAGSRGITDLRDIVRAIEDSGFEITKVISGTARGVDQLGEEYARIQNIPVKQFPADWDTHGKSAGYKRNVIMADYADALIAIWDGKSRGTAHMITIANNKRLKIYVHEI
jgi:hypothetical protein